MYLSARCRDADHLKKRTNGSIPDSDGSHEGDSELLVVRIYFSSANHPGLEARVRELERELAKSNHIISLYKHEQTENTNLIAMYEDALGTATEQIRNYCTDVESRFLAQRKHYNNLLQQEKDEHLQSRLDRDHWQAQTLKVSEMIRTASRLRTDEWAEEYSIISGLQSEVRCLRRCLGMEPEKAENETGWSYLKEMPLTDQA